MQLLHFYRVEFVPLFQMRKQALERGLQRAQPSAGWRLRPKRPGRGIRGQSRQGAGPRGGAPWASAPAPMGGRPPSQFPQVPSGGVQSREPQPFWSRAGGGTMACAGLLTVCLIRPPVHLSPAPAPGPAGHALFQDVSVERVGGISSPAVGSALSGCLSRSPCVSLGSHCPHHCLSLCLSVFPPPGLFGAPSLSLSLTLLYVSVSLCLSCCLCVSFFLSFLLSPWV